MQVYLDETVVAHLRFAGFEASQVDFWGDFGGQAFLFEAKAHLSASISDLQYSAREFEQEVTAFRAPGDALCDIDGVVCGLGVPIDESALVSASGELWHEFPKYVFGYPVAHPVEKCVLLRHLQILSALHTAKWALRRIVRAIAFLFSLLRKSLQAHQFETLQKGFFPTRAANPPTTCAR